MKQLLRGGPRLDDDDIAVAAAPGQDGERNFLVVDEQLLIDDFDRSQKLLPRLRSLVPWQRRQIEAKNLDVVTFAVNKVNRFLEGQAIGQIHAFLLDRRALSQLEAARLGAIIDCADRHQVDGADEAPPFSVRRRES